MRKDSFYPDSYTSNSQSFALTKNMPKGEVLCAVIVCMFICLSHGEITTLQTIEIHLNRYGYVLDERPLPACNNGGRIKLMTYNYLYYPSGHIDASTEKSLSPEAEFILHKMCSLEHSCAKKKFPVDDLNESGKTTVEVSFKCLDQFETFISICQTTTKIDDKIIHLVNKEHTSEFETCWCSIEGQFSLSLSDVRLTSEYNNGSPCSWAELEVNRRRYSCDPTKEGYGSVFRREVVQHFSKESILFKSDPANLEPDMIYLAVNPKGSVKLICGNKPRNTSTFKTVPLSANCTEACTTGSKASSKTSAALIIFALLCVVMALGYIVLCVKSRRRWRRYTDVLWFWKSPENDSVNTKQEKEAMLEKSPNLTRNTPTVWFDAKGSSDSTEKGDLRFVVTVHRNETSFTDKIDTENLCQATSLAKTNMAETMDYKNFSDDFISLKQARPIFQSFHDEGKKISSPRTSETGVSNLDEVEDKIEKEHVKYDKKLILDVSNILPEDFFGCGEVKVCPKPPDELMKTLHDQETQCEPIREETFQPEENAATGNKSKKVKLKRKKISRKAREKQRLEEMKNIHTKIEEEMQRRPMSWPETQGKKT